MPVKNSRRVPWKPLSRRTTAIVAFIAVQFSLLFMSGCPTLSPPREEVSDKGVTLITDAREKAGRLGISKNVRVSVTGLSPRTRYTLRVVDRKGKQLTYANLTSGRKGDIPPFTLLFAGSIMPCASSRPSLTDGKGKAADPAIVLKSIADLERAVDDRSYFVEVLEKNKVVRRAPFVVKDDGKPRIYVTDAKGCIQGGIRRGQDDVFIVGRNFPAGSTVRLFTVQDRRLWRKGDRFADLSGSNGAADVEAVKLGARQRDFFVRIWRHDLTTTGLYNVIARYTDNQRLELGLEDVLSTFNDVGFVVQMDAADPHVEQNMTVPAADGVLYYLFQDRYFNTDDVWVAVNPIDRPGGVNSDAQNARIYVVNHLDEAHWVHGMALIDASSDGFEEIPIKGGCRNQNEVRVWPAPLINGNYDVVVDFAPFGVYDQGQDIVDELDNPGFQVTDPEAFSIVYPVNPLRFFPEKEVPGGLKREEVLVVAKIHPAAAGTQVYWDSLDADDPSADAAPVDPNGPNGNDNRGNYGAAPGAPDGDDGMLIGEDASGIAATATYTGGIAFVRLHTTSQPGDNFTVRASLSSTFNSFDESAPVTVWRRLHVEVDSMGAPVGTTVNGNITNVAFHAATNTSDVTVDVNLDDGSPAPGRFQGGVLTAGGNDYQVNSNTVGAGANVLNVQGHPPNGVAFVLADDDVVPADVPDPDVGGMARAYARAFILPVFDTGQNNSNVTFDLNTETWESAAQIGLGKTCGMSTDDYWVVTVQGGFQTSCYEPGLGGDNDPDTEDTWRGVAEDSVQGVLVGEEAIRDWISANGLADPDLACEAGRSPRRQEIMCHEVGHLLSLVHTDGSVTAADPCGGLMMISPNRMSSNFTQKSLHKLRSIAKPDD